MIARGVVARFLFQKGHYSTLNRIVKPGAFLPRHGNLIGWPSEGEEVKARCKAVAVELAVRAVLVLHTP